MKLATMAFAFFSVLILSSSASLTATDVSIGSEAPDFTIANNQTSVRPQDLKGKTITVNFWSTKDAVSRERNARLARKAVKEGKEYIGICVDEDAVLAKEIIACDGLDQKNQYMSSDAKRGDPCRSYETGSGLRAYEINPLGMVDKILE